MHRSTLVLLGSNLITIVFALVFHWEISELIWIYWAQSIIIGFYQGRRMMSLERFSTEGFTSNDKPVPETPAGKRSTVAFFTFHYGLFHFGYLVFLIEMARPELSRLGWIALVASIIGFAVNHQFSFIANRERDSKRVPNLGKMMMFPYLRIIPMHLTIILGFQFIQKGASSLALLLFLLLKTFSDVAMHVIEHREKVSDS